MKPFFTCSLVLAGGLLMGMSTIWQAHADSSSSSPAVAYAKILVTQGQVKMGAATLHSGDSIAADGVLSTPKNGAARIELLQSKTILEIAPATDVILRRPRADEPEQLAIQDGMARAIVNQDPKAKNALFEMNTHVAVVAGVQADFAVIVNSARDDSEVIVFDGKAELISDQHSKNRKLVTKGQRAGIGGHFGSDPQAPKSLSRSQLRHFDKITTVTDSK